MIPQSLAPRPRWTPARKRTALAIQSACAIAGARLRRCNGVDPEPAPDLGVRREHIVKPWVAPPGYIVVVRCMHAGDVGVIRAYGPGGWTQDFPTATMANEACWRHADEHDSYDIGKDP